MQLQQLLDVIEHASLCHSIKTQPCTYPHCRQIKKLFAHASRCEVRLSGGCQFCKKVWQGLTLHSRNCKDSACRIPRCMCVTFTFSQPTFNFFFPKLCIRIYFLIYFLLNLQGSEETSRMDSNAI